MRPAPSAPGMEQSHALLAALWASHPAPAAHQPCVDTEVEMTTSPKPPPELAVSFWVPNPQAPITPVVLRIKAAPRLHLVVQAPHSPPPPAPPPSLGIQTGFGWTAALGQNNWEGWSFRTQVVKLLIKGTPLSPKDKHPFLFPSLNPAGEIHRECFAAQVLGSWNRLKRGWSLPQ